MDKAKKERLLAQIDFVQERMTTMHSYLATNLNAFLKGTAAHTFASATLQQIREVIENEPVV